jgi:hypothetical protein
MKRCINKIIMLPMVVSGSKMGFSSSIATWYGVTLQDDKVVVLQNNNLIGELPQELKLVHLQELDFTKSINWYFSFLGKLKELKVLIFLQ